MASDCPGPSGLSRVQTHLLVDEDGEADVARLLDLLGGAGLLRGEAGHFGVCCQRLNGALLISVGRRLSAERQGGGSISSQSAGSPGGPARTDLPAPHLSVRGELSHKSMHDVMGRDRQCMCRCLDKPTLVSVLGVQGRRTSTNRVFLQPRSERRNGRASALN